MGIVVERLRCEYMDRPLGIDIRRPRLSWEMSSTERSVMQEAYRIQVAESSEALLGSGPYLWDSKDVRSSASVHVEYAGTELTSRKRYHWRVKVWTNSGAESEWSEISHWEMGLIEASDWKAAWIEPEQIPVSPEKMMGIPDMLGYKDIDSGGPHSELHPCPHLRRSFAIKGKVARARIYASAHGLYSLELNGARVGDIEFTPEATAYQAYLMYQTYDVTNLLARGENCLGVVLADGWYAGRIGMMGESCQYGDRLGLLLQLEIDYVDGSAQTICSNGSFKSSEGPLRYSDIFIGERYDARLEMAGWSRPGFDDSAWKATKVVGDDLGNLVAQYGEGVKKMIEMRPQRVFVTPRGETVVDLGQVIAGRMRMRVRGAAPGTEITLEHSEILDEEGNFLMNIMGRHKDQRDVYITNGGDEVYEPSFTFHGFRYVKVTGYPGRVKIEDFMGIVLSSSLERTGSFKCSDERLNRLQENIVWSQRGNMLSIPTDCPQRERAGWTGDIQIFAPTACFNMDVDAFLTRWLRNVKVEQLADGEVPIVVPFLKSYFSDDTGASSAGWGDACVIVPWVLYQKYGDRRVLEENYGTMARWVSYIENTARENLPEGFDSRDPERIERQKYLWNTGFHFGDWLTPSVSIDMATGEIDMGKSAVMTKELIPTYFYAYSTQLMAAISTILGKAKEAQRYAELNRKIREAFDKEYVGDDGRLPLHFQGAYVLALAMDMVSQTKRGALVGQLLALIHENGDRLDTGFLSVPFLMDVLCETGHRDLAHRLLFQTACPSWLYEVEKGATTMWEAWQAITPSGKVMKVSYNHYAFGCIGDWLYRNIGGLASDAPGYDRLRIEPDFECGLEWAKTGYHSVHGEIAVAWKRSGKEATVGITVPPNVVATVVLPAVSLAAVSEGGKPVARGGEIAGPKEAEGKAIIEIGSGEYHFEVSDIGGRF